jgi:hypothetical protein
MKETTFNITSIVGGRLINKEITFSQAVTEAGRWLHGSRNHADGMQDLYSVFRAVNGYYATFNQLWDWVDETKENN